MGLCGLAGMAMIIGPMPALSLFGTTVYETTVTFDLSIIPLFVLMGSVASRAGLSRELYGAFYAWFGAFRGGLALATIGACGAFAAICGSSVATAATMSQVSLPEMQRYRYAESLATGSIAAGGIIGILIPPSVVLVLYGILTETSIGDLFIAGFLPGILTVLGFMLVIAIVTRIWPEMGPAGQGVSTVEKLRALGRTWAILLLFVLVIGGIYFGVFTPTEAAGIGAVGAFVLSALRRRLTREAVRDALLEAVQTSAMIFHRAHRCPDPEQPDDLFRHGRRVVRLRVRPRPRPSRDHADHSADLSGHGLFSRCAGDDPSDRADLLSGRDWPGIRSGLVRCHRGHGRRTRPHHTADRYERLS